MLLSFVSIFSAHCTGKLSETEFAVLERFYDEADGIQWSWNPPPPSSSVWNFPSNSSVPCANHWQGLNCTHHQTTDCPNCCSVQGIVLPMYGLKGRITSQISNLTNLRHLNLNTNHLNSSIPSQIGFLSKLQYLSLFSNSFSGQIPTQLGQLSLLTVLFVGYINFSGGIPRQLGLLINLEQLSMSKVRKIIIY